MHAWDKRGEVVWAKLGCIYPSSVSICNNPHISLPVAFFSPSQKRHRGSVESIFTSAIQQNTCSQANMQIYTRGVSGLNTKDEDCVNLLSVYQHTLQTLVPLYEFIAVMELHIMAFCKEKLCLMKNIKYIYFFSNKKILSLFDFFFIMHTCKQTRCRDNSRCVVEICSIFSCRNRPSNTHSLQTHFIIHKKTISAGPIRHQSLLLVISSHSSL